MVPTKLYGSEFPVRSVYFLWKQGSKDSALALAPSERNCAITDVQFAFMKGSLIFECFALYELWGTFIDYVEYKKLFTISDGYDRRP